MLTLYYVGATLLQSWRIKNVCNKIGEKLAQQGSVAFYTLPNAGDGYDSNLATSELCINRAVAKLSDILWLNGDQRGCCLLPRQALHIGPWISFPDAPSWLPFAYDLPRQELIDHLGSKRAEERLHLLLETEIHPCPQESCDVEHVKIEDYGKLIAWKIDSHLALLIETDLEYFTKLLISTFLQNNLLINDQLPLIRIESITFEGIPQPFHMVSSHLRKSTRSTALLSDDEWRKHLEGLHALSILANQATEFEYNKNRTEGKTGVVKPDLIPHEKQQKSVAVTSADASSSQKLNPSSVTVIFPVKQVTKADLNVSINHEVASTSASTTSLPKKIGKLKAKPTEIKKPLTATVTDATFKAADVSKATSNTIAEAALTQPKPLVSDKEKGDFNSTLASHKSMDKLSAELTPVDGISTNPAATSDKPIEKISRPGSNSALPSESNSNDRSKRRSLRRNKDSLIDSKPLNILVYSDSPSARENAVTALKELVERDMYTIYPITPQQVEEKFWLKNTALIVVCGTVVSNIGEILVDYFLHGGRVLSLCSDILHYVLPTYRTAEVREHELVQFSYDKWQKVHMMHHIFCYQPSPVRKNFSTDSDESTPTISRKPALVCPRSVELKDLDGESHNLDVKVLGIEETWNTPSLLLANSLKSGGKAVFSQVHLESKPMQFEADETKFAILKKNDQIRLEIFADLLGKHLNLSVKQTRNDGDTSKKCVYENAYFLGQHESKFELLEKLKSERRIDNIIKTSKLTMHFCGKDDKHPNVNTNLLPILIHSCPEDFSTVDYFEHLKTVQIGRLVIYAPKVSSSMDVITDLELTHGLAVLVRQQTDGIGRNSNQWLSPVGCAMFSLQLHVALDSPLGSRLPLMQHIVATAIVNAIKNHSDYKILDIGVKWPNDIYVNGKIKIGGVVVKTSLLSNRAVVNIGCGINLDNAKPTVCINDLIKDYNRLHNESLPLLKYENLVAMIFNEMERLMDMAQQDHFDCLYETYYDVWLHNNQKIFITDAEKKKKEATIIGIDNYGYLRVRLLDGLIENVHPDGNSFDILKGLIVPKFND